MANRRTVFVTLLLALSFFAIPAYSGTYSGGTGEPSNPYQIKDSNDWWELMFTTDDWNRYFVLAADVNLAGIRPILPVGHNNLKFTGVFDGRGFIIRNAAVIDTGSNDYVGIFGCIGSGAKIQNLGVEDVNVIGRERVGGLVGCNYRGSIISCYSTGNVSGGDGIIGGLVGYNDGGLLTSCYSACSVSHGYDVGGLVATNNNGGLITSCYSTGSVSGGNNTGGLVGSNPFGVIISCYSTSSVVGTGWCVGGLVGANSKDSSTNGDSSIISCYSTGSVSGAERVGGLVGANFGYGYESGLMAFCYSTGSVSGQYPTGGFVGYNSSLITSCFWDIQTSGETTGVGYGISDGVQGLTTVEMQTLSIFTSAGWDFVGESTNGLHDFWQIAANNYPRFAVLNWTLSGDGTADNPYLILDVNDLAKVWLRPFAYYRLNSNLDLSDILWSTAVIPVFNGVFDGHGCTIRNMTINQPNNSYLGTFGYVSRFGQIRNLSVENINITGYHFVGGLVGYNRVGSIISCYSTGSVSGVVWVGGLVGNNYYGSITTCYADASVNGISYIGGLVGGGAPTDIGYGSMTFCYSTGHVSGSSYTGGLVGFYAGLITSCFWDTQTSGQTTSDGGTGKTTVEMQTLATFTDAGWDFVGEIVNGPNDIWVINEGADYPRHTWGRVNLTGLYGVDFSDYASLTSHWSESCPNECAACDIAKDGKIDMKDFAVLANRWMMTDCNSCSGADITHDGNVDYEDLQEFVLCWVEDKFDCNGADIDFSSVVDWDDLKILCDYWLEGTTL